ncbi:MAG: GH92 family glycosyl hydrolase [Chitinophagaceae bacterium]|nr:GH92 family glycosyl hydrolase [Chitinophagaceae bacterium]
MKKSIVLSLCLCCYGLISFAQLTKYVNPFIGTGGHGHTFPGAAMPFAMVQLSPDTRIDGSWDGCSGYHQSDSVIYGFSHTHLSGTGCSDYGDIAFIPYWSARKTSFEQLPEKIALPFSHAQEQASPGYYKVALNAGIKVELTSTTRVGLQKYTFSKKGYSWVVLDLKHRDELTEGSILPQGDLAFGGIRRSKAWARDQELYYYFETDIEPEEIKIVKGEKGDEKLAMRFAVDAGDQIQIKTALSSVDVDGARKNMETEMPGWNFEEVRDAAKGSWELQLSKIVVSSKDELKKSIFYTALYHTMLQPNILNDVDHRYRGRDHQIHEAKGFDYYTVFSLWDTYRGAHPLYTLIEKERTLDFIKTFLAQYDQAGRLPVWELWSNETDCMIGYHAVSVIWDAYEKGIRNFDTEKAFAAMKSIATGPDDYTYENIGLPVYQPRNDDEDGDVEQKVSRGTTMKRIIGMKEVSRKQAANADALESYCKYGYVRADDDAESVSKTLEYAYNDWCIAQMAKALGKTDDYVYYLNRSNHWRNVYDPTTGFMRARKNGALYEPFSPYRVDNNFTEANSFQYSYYVPHDIRGLKAMIGQEAFNDKIDSLFKVSSKTEGREQADITGLIGQYAHGNEPSHQLIHLYRNTNAFSTADVLIKKVIDSFYVNAPDGLIGNEDCGQMSAWFVLNSIGLYPVCPGDGKYSLTCPLFDTIAMKVGTGYKKIYKQGNTGDHYLSADPYIGETEKQFKGAQISSSELNGMDPLIIQTAAKPVKQMNVDPEQNSGILRFQNPYIANATHTFKESTSLRLQCHDKEATIYYRLNQAKRFKVYRWPIKLEESASIEFFARHDSLISPIQQGSFFKLPDDRKVILHSVYNPSYTAGGPDALVDGIYGNVNWRRGDWQGFQAQDFEAIIAFNEEKSISTMSANFLEDQRSWIFYPTDVSFYTSMDSLSWELVETIPTKKPSQHEENTISKFSTHFDPRTVRYIKVVATNFGKIPSWHPGAGGDAFIFIDEIEVD